MCACSQVCMCACVQVCKCASVHVYACAHMCMCAGAHVYICVHLCMCACVQVCMCACIHVCMCTCVQVCICACLYHACIFACRYLYEITELNLFHLIHSTAPCRSQTAPGPPLNQKHSETAFCTRSLATFGPVSYTHLTLPTILRV